MFRASPCIAVVFALAASGAAYACGPAMVTDLPAFVESDLGTLSGHELSGYCSSPNVVLARVEGLERVNDAQGRFDHSRIQLRVQNVIREGSESLDGALLEVSTLSSQLRERVSVVRPMGIEPVLDSVWVMGFSPVPRGHGIVREGDPLLWTSRPLRTNEEVGAWTQKLPDVLTTDCISVRPL